MAHDRTQLIRLISEAYAVLSPKQIGEMGDSMDLAADAVFKMLDEVEAEWESKKPPAMRDRQDIVIDLDNQGCEKGDVMVEARGLGAREWAAWDGTIRGCPWKPDADGEECAYAIIDDHPKLADALEAAGYNLNLADYVPPGEKDSA